MMKQIKAILLAFSLLLTLTGCGDTESSGGSSSDKPDSSSSAKPNSSSKEDFSSQAEQTPAVEKKYLDLEGLEPIESDDEWGYLAGNVKALGNFYDYDDTLILTHDNRLIKAGYHEIVKQIQVPETAVDFAKIQSSMAILRHEDGTCSLYGIDEDDNYNFKLLREGLKLSDNSYVYITDDNTVVATRNTDTGMVYDVYSPDSTEVDTERSGILYRQKHNSSGPDDYFDNQKFLLPPGQNSSYVQDLASGDIYYYRLSSKYANFYMPVYADDRPCFLCYDVPALEGCDTLYSDAEYPYYTLRGDSAHLYRSHDEDYFSQDCDPLPLPDGYTTADIQDVFGIGTIGAIRMKDQQVYSVSYACIAMSHNPELTEFFKNEHILDMMLTDEELYILMDDNSIYKLNKGLIYKYQIRGDE